MKRIFTDWEKNFADCIFNRGFYLDYLKKLQKLMFKKQIIQLENISLKKMCRHLVSMWKCCSKSLAILLLMLSRVSRVQLCDPIDGSPPGSPCPWDSPGKNTGVGCHFLLQCMKVKSESEVAQSCPTPSDPMDCSAPGSSIHGIFQARVLEWGAIAFSHTLSIYLLFVAFLMITLLTDVR